MSNLQRVGLIGDPVEHSLSPAFQQPAFDALGLNVRYELWPTPAADLSERFADLRTGEALGANVTVPHKEAAFAAMDELSDRARRAGAVNTIVPRAGSLYGDNTDIHGFLVPLVERGTEFTTLDAVILGAGGAARGIVVALLDAGVRSVHVVNRTVERAERLAAQLDDTRIIPAPLSNAMAAVTNTGLIVNATAIGWDGNALPIEESVLRAAPTAALAYDLTYRETPFLRAAREAGLATLDGLPMLVHQGAKSFELWTGQPAPVEVMWEAAVSARAERGG